MSPVPLTSIVVCGPTASGKSALGLWLAEELGGEIINCDSVQVYRGFDVGSAKASLAERTRVPHHLIDIRHWSEDYDAASYAADARRAVSHVTDRGKIPILVGGTGLYLRAFWGDAWNRDLPRSDAVRAELDAQALPILYADLMAKDPERSRQIHPNDRFRITRALEIIRLTGQKASAVYAAASPGDSGRSRSFVIYLTPPRAALHERIAQRSQRMVAEGLEAETRGLLGEGCPPNAKPMQSIGYAESVAYIAGQMTAGEWPDRILIATRQYARRQQTWFNKVAADLVLTDATPTEAVLAACRRAMAPPVGGKNP